MSKKIVELKSKKKIELREMTIDEIDICNDMSVMKYDNGSLSHVSGLSKARTSWLRHGIKGGDFKNFKNRKDGLVDDSVLKQLAEDEKNELVELVQDYQNLGE